MFWRRCICSDGTITARAMRIACLRSTHDVEARLRMIEGFSLNHTSPERGCGRKGCEWDAQSRELAALVQR